MTEVSPQEPSRLARVRAAIGAAGRRAYRYGRRFAVTIGVIVAVLLVSLLTIDLGPAVKARAEGFGSNWLERKMPQRGVRVLMHSIAFQYFEQRSQERITRFMERIGAASDSPLGWLRFELDPELDNRFSLRLRMWPGGSDQLLAIAGPHGTPIEWLAP